MSGTATLFAEYNLLVGVVTTAGLFYLLYSQRHVVGYRRFMDFLIGGFLLFDIGGPLAALLAPAWVHAVHGTAALLIVVGLYDLVHNNLKTAEWAEFILNDPAMMRNPDEWMAPMDEEILELFHSNDLVLTPTIIAYNIAHSRESVSRRLAQLQKHGFVEKVDRGKYRMTELGDQYLELHTTTTRDIRPHVV